MYRQISEFMIVYSRFFYKRCKIMELKELIPAIGDLIPFDYSQIATPEYEALLASALESAPSVKTPVLIHMLGIPGSGKSTFYRSRQWPSHVLISFDKIMEELPGYQNDLITLGNTAAFQKWEIPARIVGYELLRRAVAAGKNIFFDHGGLFNLGINADSHLDLLNKLPQYGYRTEMYYISCPADIALARTVEREKQTRRHTPEAFIRERGRLIDEYIGKYQTCVDAFYHLDNSDGKYRLITVVRKPFARSA